jgi:hypothetical protein
MTKGHLNKVYKIKSKKQLEKLKARVRQGETIRIEMPNGDQGYLIVAGGVK